MRENHLTGRIFLGQAQERFLVIGMQGGRILDQMQHQDSAMLIAEPPHPFRRIFFDAALQRIARFSEEVIRFQPHALARRKPLGNEGLIIARTNQGKAGNRVCFGRNFEISKHPAVHPRAIIAPRRIRKN